MCISRAPFLPLSSNQHFLHCDFEKWNQMLLKNIVDYFTDLFSQVAWDGFSSWVPRAGGLGARPTLLPAAKPTGLVEADSSFFIFFFSRSSKNSLVCGPIWLILWWMVEVGHGYLATRWRPNRPPGGATCGLWGHQKALKMGSKHISNMHMDM